MRPASPAEVLRSLVFYGVFYAGTVLFVLAAIVLLPLSHAWFERAVHGWSGFHRWCVEHILAIEVRVEGRPPAGPALVALKHESFFEAIDLCELLPHPGVFAKVELLQLPGWGRAADAYGVVSVARDDGASALRKMRKDAQRLAAQGRPLAIFPEGTRVPHGTCPPLQSGFAGLYRLLGLPVVPVAVNSGPLYQRRWKKRGRITLLFHDPIEPGLSRAEIEARVHAAINSLNETRG